MRTQHLGILVVFALSGLLWSLACEARTRVARGLVRNKRVARAVENKRAVLRRLYADRGVSYPGKRALIRVFKRERQLELWAQAKDGTFRKIKTYPICAASGRLGPKRRQGDLQVPEGFYHVRVENPWSSYHLSLGINYPNASDRILGHRNNLGSAIMLHGACASIGCVSITDPLIEEVYLAAVEARLRGKRRVPVHIYPTRLDARGMRWLGRRFAHRPRLLAFWRDLRRGYDYFQRHRKLPRIRVDRRGRYHVR